MTSRLGEFHRGSREEENVWLFEKRWTTLLRYSSIVIILTSGPMLWFYFGNVATVPGRFSLLLGLVFAVIGMVAAAAHIFMSFSMIYFAVKVHHAAALLRVMVVIGIALMGGFVSVPYYYFVYLKLSYVPSQQNA
jgi:hypothetical protein